MTVDTAIKELKDSFYAQDDVKCPELAKKALAAGADPMDLIENHLLKWAQDICGRSIFDTLRESEGKELLKAENSVMLSEVVMIAECLKGCVEVIRPELAKKAKKVEVPGRVVIGTVEGDIHDIGKSLVGSMLSSAGYEVLDLGFDVPAKTFVREARMKKADILGLSCSMTMAKMVFKETIQELNKLGLRDNVKIITGGQASFENDVKTYGTDAFGASISAALSQSAELMRMLKEERQKKAEVKK